MYLIFQAKKKKEKRKRKTRKTRSFCDLFIYCVAALKRREKGKG